MKPKHKETYAKEPHHKVDHRISTLKTELLEQLDNLKRTGPLLSQDGQAAVERITELVKAMDQ